MAARPAATRQEASFLSRALRRRHARSVVVLLAAAAAAAVVASAAAAPPTRPELNPLFAAQWWLRGHTTVVDWSGNASASDGLNALGAWPTTTGEGVAVAVADSGIDVRTPALAGQLLPGRDFVTGKPLTRDPLGHGTHVATIVAGNPRHADGIFGVAPGARILPLRIGTAAGGVVERAAAAAISYAARAQVRVINASWGIEPHRWSNEPSRALTRALSAIERNPSLLLVSAAGNDASDLDGSRELPQTFTSENELTVASSNIFNSLSSFSNYGADVEVAAPGERILSAFPGDTLALADGTSMAAPMVSGVAALLFSRYPQASAAQVKQAIVTTCTQVPELRLLVECGGIVNAPAALAKLGTILAAVDRARETQGP
jgi:subtilisin family serine protease